MSSGSNIVQYVGNNNFDGVYPPPYNVAVGVQNNQQEQRAEEVPDDRTEFEKTHYLCVANGAKETRTIWDIFVQMLRSLFFSSPSTQEKINEETHKMLTDTDGEKESVQPWKSTSKMSNNLVAIQFAANDTPGTTTAAKIKAHLLIAKYHFYKGENKEAIDSFAKVEDKHKSVGAFYIEGRAHQKVGIKNNDVRELAKAVLCYEKAYKVGSSTKAAEAALCEIKNINAFVNSCELAEDKLEITEFNNSSRLYFLQAEAYRCFGQKTGSVEYLAKARFYYEKVIDTCKDDSYKTAVAKRAEILAAVKEQDLGDFYNNIGVCYFEDFKLGRAKEFYTLAAEKGSDKAKHNLAISYNDCRHVVNDIQDADIKNKALISIIDQYLFTRHFSLALEYAAKLSSHQLAVEEIIKIKQGDIYCYYSPAYNNGRSFFSRSKNTYVHIDVKVFNMYNTGSIQAITIADAVKELS